MEADAYFQYTPVSAFYGFETLGSKRMCEYTQSNSVLQHLASDYSHHDHVGGNDELKKMGGVEVYGPIVEKNKIPGLDTAVGGGDCVEFGPLKADVMDVGGHTHGHIAYHFGSEKKVFCGDALFTLGCGKMFEGTPDQFWKSLQRMRDLPDETEVYW